MLWAHFRLRRKPGFARNAVVNVISMLDTLTADCAINGDADTQITKNSPHNLWTSG
jgi:hypothetical protein